MSSIVSPFFAELELSFTLTTSPPSRSIAVANEHCVRVDGS